MHYKICCRCNSENAVAKKSCRCGFVFKKKISMGFQETPVVLTPERLRTAGRPVRVKPKLHQHDFVYDNGKPKPKNFRVNSMKQKTKNGDVARSRSPQLETKKMSEKKPLEDSPEITVSAETKVSQSIDVTLESIAAKIVDNQQTKLKTNVEKLYPKRHRSCTNKFEASLFCQGSKRKKTDLQQDYVKANSNIDENETENGKIEVFESCETAQSTQASHNVLIDDKKEITEKIEVKPVVSVNKPLATINKSVVTINESIVTINKPVVTINKPVVTINKPVVTINKPVVTINKPVVTINKPVVTVNKMNNLNNLSKKKIKLGVKFNKKESQPNHGLEQTASRLVPHVQIEESPKCTPSHTSSKSDDQGENTLRKDNTLENISTSSTADLSTYKQNEDSEVGNVLNNFSKSVDNSNIDRSNLPKTVGSDRLTNIKSLMLEENLNCEIDIVTVKSDEIINWRNLVLNEVNKIVTTFPQLNDGLLHVKVPDDVKTFLNPIKHVRRNSYLKSTKCKQNSPKRKYQKKTIVSPTVNLVKRPVGRPRIHFKPQLPKKPVGRPRKISQIIEIKPKCSSPTQTPRTTGKVERFSKIAAVQSVAEYADEDTPSIMETTDSESDDVSRKINNRKKGRPRKDITKSKTNNVAVAVAHATPGKLMERRAGRCFLSPPSLIASAKKERIRNEILETVERDRLSKKLRKIKPLVIPPEKQELFTVILDEINRRISAQAFVIQTH